MKTPLKPSLAILPLAFIAGMLLAVFQNYTVYGLAAFPPIVSRWFPLSVQQQQNQLADSESIRRQKIAAIRYAFSEIVTKYLGPVTLNESVNLQTVKTAEAPVKPLSSRPALQEILGVLVINRGEVFVNGNKSRTNHTIMSGNVIITKSGTDALIYFRSFEQSVIAIDENTEIKLDFLPDAILVTTRCINSSILVKRGKVTLLSQQLDIPADNIAKTYEGSIQLKSFSGVALAVGCGTLQQNNGQEDDPTLMKRLTSLIGLSIGNPSVDFGGGLLSSGPTASSFLP